MSEFNDLLGEGRIASNHAHGAAWDVISSNPIADIIATMNKFKESFGQMISKITMSAKAFKALGWTIKYTRPVVIRAAIEYLGITEAEFRTHYFKLDEDEVEIREWNRRRHRIPVTVLDEFLFLNARSRFSPSSTIGGIAIEINDYMEG